MIFIYGIDCKAFWRVVQCKPKAAQVKAMQRNQIWACPEEGTGVGQRGQRTTAGQLQAPGGQEEDKTQTQRSWGATPLATSLGRVAP